MSNIECRIEALEKANRRWRYAAGLLGGLLLISLAGAMKSPHTIPEVLQAKRIEIITPDGKTAMVLSADAHGSALSLLGYGQNHERAITLAADKEGARLMMMKHAEAPLLTAQIDDSGALLALFDGRQPSQEPKSIILRTASPTKQRQGGAGITISQGVRKDGLLKAGLSVDESGTSCLFLGDSQNKAVSIRVNQQDGKVEFVDRNKKNIWSTP